MDKTWEVIWKSDLLPLRGADTGLESGLKIHLSGTEYREIGSLCQVGCHPVICRDIIWKLLNLLRSVSGSKSMPLTEGKPGCHAVTPAKAGVQKA